MRVVVLGNSVPILTVPARPTRADGTYGEVLERRLRDQGIDAEVDNHSRLFELLHEGGPRFRRELAATLPDVLVLHYGVLELQPNVVPYQLVRHLTREDRGGRGLPGAWRRRGVPVVWPRVRAYQRWASARAGTRTWRLPPKRFAAELDHLVSVARGARALVLVVDVHRPNERLEHFMPGIERRWALYQDVLREVVDRRDDPGVRLVEASKIVDELDPADRSPDGLHLTPTAHRLVAARLADEIVQYREEHP
jgi:lysophospholipase L1-like esterase